LAVERVDFGQNSIELIKGHAHSLAPAVLPGNSTRDRVVSPFDSGG
jgi:hypothetical protein